MTSFVVARSESTRDGVEPFDPGRHMRQVADLVAEVFADELDPRGRGALRDMRVAGSLTPFLGGLISMALFNEAIAGCVWVKDDRVIGNVTLQALDTAGARWRISNVAVAPAYRGRGIARALMQASLREIAERGGNWAVLQVRSDNAVAHGLYLSLGFADVCRDGLWRLPVPAPETARRPDPDIRLVPLRLGLGSVWLELARAARTPLAQWADPLNPADYTLTFERWIGEGLGGLLGLHRVERWATWQGDTLQGAVETQANRLSGYDTLRFAVRPAARGRLERTLVAQGLAALARSDFRPVMVTHSGDHREGVAALEEAGFRIQRDLLTMRRAVVSDDLRL